jgi:transposase
LGLDHEGLILAFAEVTEGFTSEMETVDTFRFPPGSVLVLDREYNSYAWHKQLTDRGLFWVTRPHKNMLFEVVESYPVKAGSGVISDQIVRLTSVRARKHQLDPIRRVESIDEETGKRYVFITNQMQWSAKTVAEIYKSRWEIELFFKWIKQNLKIRAFLGHSLNAVAAQVFVALCVYLLMAYLKFVSRSGYSVQTILRLLQMKLFARRSIEQLLHRKQADPPDPQTAFSLRAA